MQFHTYQTDKIKISFCEDVKQSISIVGSNFTTVTQIEVVLILRPRNFLVIYPDKLSTCIGVTKNCLQLNV